MAIFLPMYAVDTSRCASAEKVIRRGEDVRGRDGTLAHGGRVTIGAADDTAAGDAAAREQTGIRLGPVIAAATPGIADARRAPMFAQDQLQGLVQQAAL